MRKIFKVKDGKAVELFGEQVYAFSESCDWENEILVFCKDAAMALDAADCYEAGIISYDNIFYPNSYGKLIVGIAPGPDFYNKEYRLFLIEKLQEEIRKLNATEIYK